MNRFSDYATTKREIADALYMIASGAVTPSQSRADLTTAAQFRHLPLRVKPSTRSAEKSIVLFCPTEPCVV